jgi:hypothetical protein
MPQLTIPDDTYQRLARRAAALHVPVEQLVTPALERVAEGAEPGGGPPPTPPGGLTDDQWQARFDQLLATIQSRAGRYPPGFQADVSRDSIYEGCGE